ncbi:MAG TPA: response regulator, partial [Planctomycetaceae bacterium]|nr:response regulator [Planctomycetaceae bacterium]
MTPAKNIDARKSDAATIEPAKADAPRPDPAKPVDAGDLSSIPIRVLIVDDDEAHAQAVAESLRRINCDCAVATSGARGIAL